MSNLKICNRLNNYTPNLIFDMFGVRFPFETMHPYSLIPWHKHRKSQCLRCVYAICNSQHCQTKNTNTRSAHPISDDMYKHTCCVIAILIIVSSIPRSQTPPHLLCFLTWHLPDNASHLFIHRSANTPGRRCTLPPRYLQQYAVSLLLFSFPDAALRFCRGAVCSQKADRCDTFGYMTSCLPRCNIGEWGNAVEHITRHQWWCNNPSFS